MSEIIVCRMLFTLVHVYSLRRYEGHIPLSKLLLGHFVEGVPEKNGASKCWPVSIDDGPIACCLYMLLLELKAEDLFFLVHFRSAARMLRSCTECESTL